MAIKPDPMKRTIIKICFMAAIVPLIALLEGCKLFSLHPLYTKDDIVRTQAIEGKWRWDESGSYLLIAVEDDSAYRFTQVDGPDTTDYLMHLTQLGGELFMDLYPYESCGVMKGESKDCRKLEYLVQNFIPVHSFSKVEIGQEKLVITEFDVDRLKSLFRQNRIRLRHEKLDEEDLIILTASTPDLRKFIGKYAGDPKAFLEPVEMTRVP